jgi:hypothetical protein
MNSLVRVFDNIGFTFTASGNDLVQISNIKGYNSLNSSHLGYYIPYIVRNYVANGVVDFEVGVGLVKNSGDKICVERVQIAKSSNNDSPISFSQSNKTEFFIFANQSGFDKSFNNVLLKSANFITEAVAATYLVDATDQTIETTLPKNSDSDNLVIEYKVISGDNALIIRNNNGTILLSANKNNPYVKLAYNNGWYNLLDKESSSEFSSLSVNDPTFSTMAIPGGSPLSFQYNDGAGGTLGADVYWNTGNKILIGSSSESLAHHVIPTSGSGSVIFNKDKQSSDFIINGSGTRNFFFTYDGRIGLNIPSGSRPITVFHLVNTICQEGIRLENRSACHPANITLYHAPSGSIAANSVISEINLSGKNSSSNKTDYAKIQARAINLTAGSNKGQLDFVVLSPSTGVVALSINPDSTIVGYSGGNRLSIANNGISSLGYSNSSLDATSSSLTLRSPSVNIQGTSVAIGSGGSSTVTATNLYATSVQSNTIKIPSVSPNSILAVDASGYVVSADSTIRFPSIPSGMFLTTAASGSVTGVYKTTDYFLTEQDITWNKFPKRTANICLRQIVLTSSADVSEFSVGDQIAVVSGSTTYYRTVTSLDIQNNLIVGILVNQNLSENSVSNVSVYSITKAGYLLLQIYTEPGTVSDATSCTISLRPGTSTVFNSKSKDIDFLVYGIDTIPALSVKANNGTISVQSGTYSSYATQQETLPFAIPVSASGDGVSSLNNTVNFKNTASGYFSGMLSTVGSNGLPSYYGTYDQNGNASEWIADPLTVSTSISQYAAGGAWNSVSGQQLRGMIPLDYSGNYNYVGFRVCGAYGLVDDSYIQNTVSLQFVPVNNVDNVSDTGILYAYNGTTYVSTGISNLGKTPDNYRIGKYEITNDQYIKFLNVVAKTDNYSLFSSSMSGTAMGGISRSGTAGNYSYSTRTNMGNKPVVYANYLSSIRFINWLHNGAPTGTGLSNNITEDGAYTLLGIGSGSYQITKNSYQKYWLPNIHEWHKAAYFTPVSLSSSTGTSSVNIKRNDAYLVNSGTLSGTPYSNYANLNVSGWTYSDHLVLGDRSFVGPSGDTNNNASLVNGTITIQSGTNSHRVTVGRSNNVSINTSNSGWNGNYGNVIDSTGVTLSSSGSMNLVSVGQMKIYSPLSVLMSGLTVDTLNAKTIQKVDASGSLVPTYSGLSGSLVYKQDDYTAATSSQFRFINGYLTMPSGDSTSPLYVDSTQKVSTYSGILFGSGLVTIQGNLVTENIQVAPALPFYSGSILTHNGTGYATWQPAEYLKAEGMSWSRYAKRPVNIYQNKIVFTDAGATLADLRKEFDYTDTIALINAQTREPYYIKAADGYYVVDNDNDPIEPSITVVVNGSDGIELSFCPNSPWPVVSGVPVSGYAYAVTKGAYLSMQIDPAAISGFSCQSGVVNNSLSNYSFKPSTLNTISIRPEKHTAFNLLAADINFAIYGHRRTPYNRYEPSLFGLDSNGLPSGLIPAFVVDARVPNAASGSVESGVFFSGYTDLGKTLPTGYNFDVNPKININTKTSYVISSITSGVSTLDHVADLTVNGFTYSSGILADDIYLRPTPSLDNSSKYVVNAPLTVDRYGKIVSQVPGNASTVPGSPTSVTGVAGSDSVTLSWLAPTENGGRVVINYIIEYSANAGNTWTTVSKPSSSQVSYVVTGLTNAVSYVFRVSAVNSVGTGSPSIVSSSVTPTANVPSQVLNLTATKQSLQRTLTWNAPSSQGATSIIDYVVEYSSNNGVTWTTYSDGVSATTGAVVTGLFDGPRYLFRVKAQNSNGYGSSVIVASLGDDPYSEPVDNTDSTSIWDFGKIAFTGVCS